MYLKNSVVLITSFIGNKHSSKNLKPNFETMDVESEKPDASSEYFKVKDVQNEAHKRPRSSRKRKKSKSKLKSKLHTTLSRFFVTFYS
jgi:hypothetical protein